MQTDIRPAPGPREAYLRPPVTGAHKLQEVKGRRGADCSAADESLLSFETFKRKHHLSRQMLGARQQAERIAGLLHFARELGLVRTDEPDESVFEELALLFDSVRDAAERAARDLRAALEGCDRGWRKPTDIES